MTEWEQSFMKLATSKPLTQLEHEELVHLRAYIGRALTIETEKEKASASTD